MSTKKVSKDKVKLPPGQWNKEKVELFNKLRFEKRNPKPPKSEVQKELEQVIKDIRKYGKNGMCTQCMNKGIQVIRNKIKLINK